MCRTDLKRELKTEFTTREKDLLVRLDELHEETHRLFDYLMESRAKTAKAFLRTGSTTERLERGISIWRKKQVGGNKIPSSLYDTVFLSRRGELRLLDERSAGVHAEPHEVRGVGVRRSEADASLLQEGVRDLPENRENRASCQTCGRETRHHGKRIHSIFAKSGGRNVRGVHAKSRARAGKLGKTNRCETKIHRAETQTVEEGDTLVRVVLRVADVN